MHAGTKGQIASRNVNVYEPIRIALRPVDKYAQAMRVIFGLGLTGCTQRAIANLIFGGAQVLAQIFQKGLLGCRGRKLNTNRIQCAQAQSVQFIVVDKRDTGIFDRPQEFVAVRRRNGAEQLHGQCDTERETGYELPHMGCES